MLSQQRDGPSGTCTVVGMLMHYSWLVMFVWSFLCCFHMFRVFTSGQTSRSRRQNQDGSQSVVWRNVTLTLLTPLCIIACIIVINIIIYEGERIGYGYRICSVDNGFCTFIVQSKMLSDVSVPQPVFAIHIPLLAVTLGNASFFTVVVCKIWGVRRLQKGHEFRKEDKSDLIIYMKLSTVTGMFWTMVVLGEAFNNDIVRSLAIVANGCQGVFIFVSFILNQRVLQAFYKTYGWFSSCFLPERLSNLQKIAKITGDIGVGSSKKSNYSSQTIDSH